MLTIQESIDLVQSRIRGKRKWTDSAAYIHSLRVYELLKKHGFDEDTQLAGLLHDIIEDSWKKDENWEEIEKKMTFEDIKELWYSDNIINLINLSTLDNLDWDSYERWERMLKKIIQENNKDAWAVKLADISDNLTECHLMPNKEKLDIFLNKKCPVFIYYGNKYFWWTEFYNEFLERYFGQIKSYNQYFIS